LYDLNHSIEKKGLPIEVIIGITFYFSNANMSLNLFKIIGEDRMIVLKFSYIYYLVVILFIILPLTATNAARRLCHIMVINKF
jgi:hypothetical protein